jgi:hypothetical protein
VAPSSHEVVSALADGKRESQLGWLGVGEQTLIQGPFGFDRFAVAVEFGERVRPHNPSDVVLAGLLRAEHDGQNWVTREVAKVFVLKFRKICKDGELRTSTFDTFVRSMRSVQTRSLSSSGADRRISQ